MTKTLLTHLLNMTTEHALLMRLIHVYKVCFYIAFLIKMNKILEGVISI